MPGLPVMGGIEQLTNGVQITWDGPSGYYQVYQKSNSLSAPWVALGKATNLVRYAVITKLYSNAFFRVSGPAPKYAGAKVCVTCHASICRYETNTPHASAFSSTTFKAPAARPTACACPATRSVTVCRPVSMSPTGRNFFLRRQSGRRAMRKLSRPGGQSRERDRTIPPSFRGWKSPPRFAAAATAPVRSPTTNNAPTFEEWSASGHGAVVPDALQAMSSSTNNIRSCGVCHSGSARLRVDRRRGPRRHVDERL